MQAPAIGPVIIYALFACTTWIAPGGGEDCVLAAGIPMFTSLEECRGFATRLYPQHAFGADGRLWTYVNQKTGPAEPVSSWVECRHRHVDTWEPQ